MRKRTLGLGLFSCALLVSACAAPRPTEQHWGEAQRDATLAMIHAAQNQPGRGLDAAGANAAYFNYLESLEPPRDEPLPKVLLPIVEHE
jgi:hypothetical protein